MEAFRTYGTAPFRVAVLHGGPGAPGEMAPVARRLGAARGVLEPLQSATTLDGQVAELASVLRAHATPPVVLVGWSWGAWLALILAARSPELVRALVLLGCPPLREEDAAGIMPARLARLAEEERAEVEALLADLECATGATGDAVLARLGSLLAKADVVDPIALDTEVLPVSLEVHRGVWPDAAQLRRSGELLRLAHDVRCPVVAIHGEDDPHPAAGVLGPLSAAVREFRGVALPACGHYPWLERGARERFFEVLAEELSKYPDR